MVLLLPNIRDFVINNNLDGVDIDWEYPSNPTEWTQCIALLNALKNHNDLKCKRISIALPAYLPNAIPWFYPNSDVPQQIWEAVDAFHLMTYDDPNWPTHSDATKSKEIIDAWANLVPMGGRTLDKEKLFIGCAFYALDGTPYKEGGANSVNPSDKPETVQDKANHCYTQGYGGVFIWELSQDVTINNTNPPSLLNAIWTENNNANHNHYGYSIATITTQPAATTTVAQGSISGSLSVAAKVLCIYDAITYQWYKNTTSSNTDGTSIAGATGVSYTIPANLAAGTWWFGFAASTARRGCFRR